MNCQFFPSCSQYGAIAINKKGPILGLFATSDRIIRCNPSAMKNHSTICRSFYQDGRIIDMLKPEYINNEKSPVVAGILSIVPGLGRIYSKKYIDGLFGFLLTATAYHTAIRSNKKNSILAPFFIIEHLYFLPTTFDEIYLEFSLVAALFPGIIAFLMYTKLQQVVGASIAGLTVYLMPIYGSIYGMVLFSENLVNYHFYGALMVLLGIFLAKKKYK